MKHVWCGIYRLQKRTWLFARDFPLPPPFQLRFLKKNSHKDVCVNVVRVLSIIMRSCVSEKRKEMERTDRFSDFYTTGGSGILQVVMAGSPEILRHKNDHNDNNRKSDDNSNSSEKLARQTRLPSGGSRVDHLQ